MDDISGTQVVDVVELLNPVYDEQNKILKFSLISENLTTTDTGPQSRFGQTTLLIDEKKMSGLTIGLIDLLPQTVEAGQNLN